MACPGEIRHMGSRKTPKSVKGHAARWGNVHHLEERRGEKGQILHCSRNKTDIHGLIELTCPACVFQERRIDQSLVKSRANIEKQYHHVHALHHP